MHIAISLMLLGIAAHLSAQDVMDQTGTLNTAAIIDGNVVITADSAVTNGLVTRLDGTRKLFQIGLRMACTVEGHLNETSRVGPVFMVDQAIITRAREEPLAELQDVFPALVGAVRDELEAGNWKRFRTGVRYLGAKRGDELDSNGRYYVTGVICAGISSHGPVIKAAHITSNPAIGDMLVIYDDVTDHVAQGYPQEYGLVFDHGNWPLPRFSPMVRPPWAAFNTGLIAVNRSLDQTHSLAGLTAQEYEEVLRGVYWSVINGAHGKVLAPVHRWVMDSKEEEIHKDDFNVSAPATP